MCQPAQDGSGSTTCPDPLTCYLIRAQQGDQDAFVLFVEESQLRLLGRVGHFLKQRGAANYFLEAEDIVQSAYCQAWANLALFNPGRAAWPWLWAIARNRAVDHLRRRRPGYQPPSNAGEGETQASRDPSPEEVVLAMDAWAILQQALAELPDDHRQALDLRYLEEMSYEDICAEMAVQQTALGSLLHRARQRLREVLARHGIDRDSLRGWLPPGWDRDDDATGKGG